MIQPIGVISVDPGQKGSFCLLVPTVGQINFLPTTNKPMLIAEWLHACKREYDIRIIMIEDVHAIFGTSAGSNFKFGYNTGLVNALAEASGIGVDRITPKKWQQKLGCKKKGKLLKQEVAEIVERLYPLAVVRGPKGGIQDGKSDSLGIAHAAYHMYK